MKLQSNNRLPIVTEEAKTILVAFNESKVTIEEPDKDPITLFEYDSVRASIGISYDDLVSLIIRDRYPSDKMEAIINNGTDTPEYKDMQSWRKTAKAIAKQVLNIEPTLESSKSDKIDEITEYDESSSVNEFYLNGSPAWVDRETRSSLKSSISDEISLGRASTTVYINGTPLTMPCEEALTMLAQIEVYAKDCYLVTESHKFNVNSLSSIDEVNNYDYKVGYPEKLNF